MIWLLAAGAWPLAGASPAMGRRGDWHLGFRPGITPGKSVAGRRRYRAQCGETEMSEGAGSCGETEMSEGAGRRQRAAT